jgi:hypothetical protein
VEKDGFKASTRSLELQVQQSARVDFDLQIGNVTESIEVTAQAAVLQSENATVGTVIENKRIVELPLNGRNYLQLVALSPNVSYGFPSAGQAGSRQGGVRADQSIAVGGQRAQFNRYTLDGVENTDPNFNTFVVFPSVDALQEFKVQTGIYAAEFGRGATQINVSTKPGTNDYHGTLFHFLRNDKLDAKNYAFTSAVVPAASSGASRKHRPDSGHAGRRFLQLARRDRRHLRSPHAPYGRRRGRSRHVRRQPDSEQPLRAETLRVSSRANRPWSGRTQQLCPGTGTADQPRPVHRQVRCSRIE